MSNLHDVLKHEKNLLLSILFFVAYKFLWGIELNLMFIFID
jgi:hypothetical protein